MNALSKFYKYALVQALAVWLFIAVSFISRKVGLLDLDGVGDLIFLFVPPLLWTSWLVCAVTDRRNPPWLLVLLWGLIDLVILVMLYQHMGPVDNRPRSGAEFVLAIDYLPFTIPLMIFGPLALGLMEKLMDGLFALSGHVDILAPNGVLRAWLEMSIPSALLSVIFAYSWRAGRNRSTEVQVK